MSEGPIDVSDGKNIGKRIIWRLIGRVRFQEQSGHRFHIAKCPLMAQSGHSLAALHMSAFGGKADVDPARAIA
jgi:hypothetical protein